MIYANYNKKVIERMGNDRCKDIFISFARYELST